jgi:hypothetical protein
MNLLSSSARPSQPLTSRVLAVALVATALVGAVAWSLFGQPEAAGVISRSGGPERPHQALEQTATSRSTTGTVILYGDSLAWEAKAPFRAALLSAGATQVILRTFGGTAICDWLPQMRVDESGLHPDAVVIEFSGDEFTPCMRGPTGQPLAGAHYYERYLSDAQAALSIFAASHTSVYFAGAPVSRQAWLSHDPDADRLNQMYASLAGYNTHVHYVDAGSAVLDHGGWTETLPCLPVEPCTGGPGSDGGDVNVVRGPDGNHFCPVAPPAIEGVIVACSVYSSGAYRYGVAMAAAVIDGWQRVQTDSIGQQRSRKNGTVNEQVSVRS